MKIDYERLQKIYSNTEFFLICVFPQEPLSVPQRDFSSVEITDESDYWAITSRSPGTNTNLLHQFPRNHVLFRGYELDLGIHTYSASANIAAIKSQESLVDGVFFYLDADLLKSEITIKSDPFGISPVYYRAHEGSHFFASHPSLIHLEGDRINFTSWMSLIQNGYNLGDDTFYKAIRRFPPGNLWVIGRDRIDKSVWFDLTTLPEGNETIVEGSFVEVEEAYSRSISKCLRLSATSKTPITLPFSSGHDSRRFLATMLENKVGFSAVTCQSFHKKHDKWYDIDSHFAPEIAGAFSVGCPILRASSGAKLKAQLHRQAALIGTETFMHEWSLPLWDWIKEQPPSIIIDGLAGDVFGNSGFEFPGLHESPEKDLAILLREFVGNEVFAQLSARFPSKEVFSSYCLESLSSFNANMNRAEFAFLQYRSRRAISPWSTMMHPPGHVVVFPYFGLDFVRTTLRYRPADKYKWLLQTECLKRYHQAYFDFRGSRNMPKELAPVNQDVIDSHMAEREKYLYGDLKSILHALPLLSFMNQILLLVSIFYRPFRKRRAWIINPLLKLVKTNVGNVPFISC